MPTIGNTPARPRAANSTPIPLDAIQIHQEAENALSMAMFHLRQPACNLNGATRQAVKAMSAIHQLRVIGFGQAANDSGRA